MSPRRYVLKPWLIRAMIPEGIIGTYVLWSPSAPVYVGRSDTSLRQRLLEHSRAWPDIHFTYDAAISIEAACTMECSLFHALGEHAAHIDHSQRASVHGPNCPFCIAIFQIIQTDRLGQQTISA